MSNIRKIVAKILMYSGYYHFQKQNSMQDLVILMYHKISGNDKTETKKNQMNFASHMRYLSKEYNVISFDELHTYFKLGLPIPKKSALVTFDDGYKDNYDLAYPILKKYNVPATIFLTTGHIGSNQLFWWDKVSYLIKNTNKKVIEVGNLGKISLKNKGKSITIIQRRLKSLPEKEKNKLIKSLESDLMVNLPKTKDLFLSWKDVKTMFNHNITFGAHTVTHPIITNVPLSVAKKEIMDSKIQIENQIGSSVNVFAYPNGCSDQMSVAVDEFLQKKGFNFSLSTIYGLNKRRNFRLKRIGIESTDDLAIFKLKMLGVGSLIAPIYIKLAK